jgi:hypothetical protein
MTFTAQNTEVANCGWFLHATHNSSNAPAYIRLLLSFPSRTPSVRSAKDSTRTPL